MKKTQSILKNKIKQIRKKLEQPQREVPTRKVAIIKVEPINFTIRNEREKQAIVIGFQHFLNSLEFPIQIVVGTDSLNLDNYIKELELRVEGLSKETRNDIFNKHFSSYKEHLLTTIREKSVLDRRFYIAIPELETLGLDIQLDIIQHQLKALNLKSKRLDDNELTQVLAGFFNDSFEDEDKQKWASEKIDESNYLHYLIAPKYIRNIPDKIIVGDKVCRTIYADGYPRNVEAGFLDKIITLNGDFDLAMHIEPIPIETTMIMLNRELLKQRTDLFAAKTKSILNPSLEIKYKDTRNVLENLQKGKEKMFNISLYVTCKSKTYSGLNLLTKKVESELNSMLIIPKLPIFRMSDGVKSTVPFAGNSLDIKRNITTSALSAFFPFTSQFLQVDNTGVWMGLNKNDVPLIKDIFNLTNPNGIILASSGSGKSYWTKLFVIRQLMNGVKAIVIDPQGEYKKLTEKFNGQVINISRTSETIINPFDLMGHDYIEKRLALMDLFPIMLGEMSEIQKSVIDRALTGTYERKGITQDPQTWNNSPPTLGDLLEELEKMSKGATVIERETYRSLINRLSMYVTGVFSFMNKHTNLNFDNNFVCFNIGDMPKQVKPVIMFLILDYVYMNMRKGLERKLLVIDEAWSLLGKAEESSYIFEIVKTSRKFNLGLLLITQDVADLLKSEAGNAVLANTAYTILMRQKPAVIENISETFHLSMVERQKLLTASVGEGILLMENEHTELKVIASKEEHELITTNADELLKEEEKKPAKEEPKEKKEVEIKVDETKGIFRKGDLNEDEIAFLLKKGYVLSSHVPLGGGRQNFYLLKPRANEGNAHFFLVKVIEEYLKQFTDKVETANSSTADIIFKAGSKKVAIEVETGSLLKKDKRKLDEKIKEMNRKFKDDWFFVVTHSDNAYHYSKLGKTYTRKNICKVLRMYFKNTPLDPTIRV